jgi:hypothetical protein
VIAGAQRSSAPEAEAARVAPALSLGVRGAGRSARFWLVAGLVALVIAGIASYLTGAGASLRPALSAESSTPNGSRALAEVLRQQGVQVIVVDTLAEAEDAARASADPTLFFYDANGYLTGDQLRALAGLGPRMVVAGPDFLTLDTLAPGMGFGGVPASKRPEARCDLPAAQRAGTLSAGESTLRPGEAPASVTRTGCFPGGDGTFSVINQESDAGTVTFVAPTEVFENGSITAEGNAALALNLLGASDTLIWYLPTPADVVNPGPPSIGELTPGWVTPALLLLALVTVAAAIWRGRRFGPLVAENLPVTVKAGETMEGRGRLYARTNARLRAIDTLRVGTVTRLSGVLGLPRTATVDEVAVQVALVTDRPLPQVRDILVDAIPDGDRDLVLLSDRLAELERTVRRLLEPAWGDASAATRAAPARPDTGE